MHKKENTLQIHREIKVDQFRFKRNSLLTIKSWIKKHTKGSRGYHNKGILSSLYKRNTLYTCIESLICIRFFIFPTCYFAAAALPRLAEGASASGNSAANVESAVHQ